MLQYRVIFMGDHIPIRPDRSLLLGSQTSKLSLWDVVYDENNSMMSKNNDNNTKLNTFKVACLNHHTGCSKKKDQK